MIAFGFIALYLPCQYSRILDVGMVSNHQRQSIMLIRLLCVVLGLAGTISVGAQTQKTENNDYYLAKSDPKLTQLLHIVEKHHMQPGLDQIKSRQYPQAWGSFDFILRYFPNHPRALLLMSELCEKWRNPKCNMDAYFEKGIRMSPENSGIHLTKGVYLQKSGKLNDAIESYKKALEFNPGSANAHYNLGLAYTTQKQYVLANEHAQQAYNLGIDLPGLRNKLVAAGAWKTIETKPAEEAQQTGDANTGTTSK